MTDNISRGPRPQSLADIKAAGFLSILNLESGAYEIFHNDKYEFEHPSDFGLKGYDIPLGDILPPCRLKVAAALSILARPEKIYVHCLHGVDRTGFVCAAFRMQRQGWTYEAAYKELRQLGFHLWSYWYWLPALKTYEVNK